MIFEIRLENLIKNTHFWLILIVFFIITYLRVLRYWTYFSKQNVKFIRGFPLLGTNYKILFGLQALTDAFENAYKMFPHERFVGIYEFLGRPTYVIRDPELIKDICIKDFNHFANHAFYMDESIDPLFAKSLFIIRDNEWRNARTTLSPAFTGSKMRKMLTLMNACAIEFCKDFVSNVNATESIFELKDLFMKYSCDTISSCAFGMKTSALRDKNDSFYERGIKMASFEGIQGFKFMALRSIPSVMKWLHLKIYSNDTADYYRNLVLGNVKQRETHKIVRPDMIHLLIKAKRGMLENGNSEEEKAYENIGFSTVNESLSFEESNKNLQKWDDDDIVAHCMVFFIAGFVSSATAKCFMAHELAANPDIQDKLYAEIKTVHEELNGGELTYEIIQTMKYMDMVVSETFRRWSTGTAIDRSCNKPYVLEKDDGTRIQLNVGDTIWIPARAIQMDPKYYPNPKKFDPERFNDDNKHKIQSGTFFPFGIGPRSCIGSRFALMQIKTLMYYLLLDYRIETCSKTDTDLKVISKTIFTLDVQNGFYVKLIPRNT